MSTDPAGSDPVSGDPVGSGPSGPQAAPPPSGAGWVRYALLALLVAGLVLAVVLVVRGLSGDDQTTAATASPSPSPSPTATPTPAPVVWAGEVCVARDDVKAAVSALGRNLSYDVTSDASALEQIDRQLRIQVLAVGDSLQRLGTALQGVPVDFKAANDLVVAATKAKDDTTEAIEATRQNLDAMVNADSVVAGVAEAAKALVSGKAAFEAGSALVGIVGDSVSTAQGELKAAFDAAPQCQGG